MKKIPTSVIGPGKEEGFLRDRADGSSCPGGKIYPRIEKLIDDLKHRGPSSARNRGLPRVRRRTKLQSDESNKDRREKTW